MKKFFSIWAAIGGILLMVLFLSWFIDATEVTKSEYRIYDKENFLILDNNTALSEMSEEDVCVTIFIELNKIRTERGECELTWNEDLAACAFTRARECEVKWSHTRPNGEPWYSVNPDIMYGENLAKGYRNPNVVVQQWVASPSHFDNIIHSEFKYVGIAKYNDYWACEFCY